jgi:PKD repeat protein
MVVLGGRDSIYRGIVVSVDSTNPCIVILPTLGTAPTQTTCSGTIYDDGGQYGAYSDLSNSSVTMAPTGASSVRLTFTRFRMEDTYDYLYVYSRRVLLSRAHCWGSTRASLFLPVWCRLGQRLRGSTFSDTYVHDTGFAINWTCNLPTTPPTVSFIADDTNSCSGTIHFYDHSTGGTTSWRWFFGDVIFASPAKPNAYIQDQNGAYTVTLIGSNAYGSRTSTRTRYVHVNRTCRSGRR